MWSDLRHAVRALATRPGFSLAVMLTLALGIGANAALFSVAYALLFRPLPFPGSERLVTIESRLGGEAGHLSAREVRDIQRDTRTLADIAAHYPSQYNLTGGGRPEALVTTIGTASLFRVLGVTPLHGDPWPDSADWTRQYTVVLNHGLWMRRYGGDPSIVGRSVRLDGFDYLVAGVLPPGFDYPTRADVFRAVTEFNDAAVRRFGVVARLQPGATLAQLQMELDAFAAAFAALHPSTNQGLTFRAHPLRDRYVGHLRPYVGLLGAGVAFVLLIACANIANLLLSRAIARQGEVAIRTALGASRARIVRQWTVEAVVMAVFGGVIALGLAALGAAFLTSLVRIDLPFWFRVSLDWRLLAFTAVISLGTGILVGLIPALQASRIDLHDVLRLDARRATAGSGARRLREALVVVEVALTVLLLAGAVLMARSLAQLRGADPGFDAAGLLTLRTDPPWTRYAEIDQIATFYRRAAERIAMVPGVEGAATNMVLPLTGQTGMTQTMLVEGQVSGREGEQPVVNYQVIGPGYFEVMKIPLVAGRTFTPHDRGKSMPAAIVSARTADRFWPGQDPLGKRLRTTRRIHGSGSPSTEEVILTVVGVVRPVTFTGPDDATGLDVYVTQDQTYAGDTFFVVRARGEPAALARAVTAAIQEIDPEQSVFDVRTMNERVESLVWQRRASGGVLSALAAVALVLAAVGIYAVLAYAMRRRWREMGIRVALGAGRADLLGLVLRQGMRPVWIGLAVGLCAALAGARALRHLLYQVTAFDPVTFVAVPATLMGVALLACYLPARRAVRIDAVDALRAE